MDIHKPKPAHNWREFLTEIGTIICGILIALSLEQAIEFVHHERQVEEAHKALKAEISWNLGALQMRWSLIDCTTRRLNELNRWWESARHGRPLDLTANLDPPQSFIMRSSVWTVSSGGGVALLPLPERITYSRVYDAFANQMTIRDQERQLWTDLSPFRWAERLDQGQLMQVKRDLEALRVLNGRVDYNRAAMLRDVGPLGITESDIASALGAEKDYLPGRNRRFCEPLLAEGSAAPSR